MVAELEGLRGDGRPKASKRKQKPKPKEFQKGTRPQIYSQKFITAMKVLNDGRTWVKGAEAGFQNQNFHSYLMKSEESEIKSLISGGGRCQRGGKLAKMNERDKQNNGGEKRGEEGFWFFQVTK